MDGSFHLTATECARACWMGESGVGQRYSILAVRRGRARGVPASMDLLDDPVNLVEIGQLTQMPDGYVMTY